MTAPLRAAASIPVGYGTTPNTVAVGDLNEDGNPDLVTADGSGTVATLIGVGDGTFGSPTLQPTGATTDQLPLVMSTATAILTPWPRIAGMPTPMFCLKWIGRARDGKPVRLWSHQLPDALGDLNGDGKLDVALAQGNGDQTARLLNMSAYTPKVSVAPHSGATAGGTEFTITGTNFTGATKVQFGSASATNR